MKRPPLLLTLIFIFLVSCSHSFSTKAPDDPNIWLEDIGGKKSLEWVKNQNERAVNEIMSDALYNSMNKDALKILNSKEKIPFGNFRNGYVYNFWKDDEYIRGIWRRTKPKEYEKQSPKWEILLDIDKLGQDENESWVYKSSDCLPPEYNRCLVKLSRGGKDASVIREFDVKKKQFIENGFNLLKEAKSYVTWVSENEVIVGTDFGKDSLTESGYPRILKLWKRGARLSSAKTIYTVDKKDVIAEVKKIFRPEGNLLVIIKWLNFWDNVVYIVDDNYKLTEIPIPHDAELANYFKGHIIFSIKSDWEISSGDLTKTFLQGSVVSFKKEDISEDDFADKINIIFKPSMSTHHEIKKGVYAAKDYIIVPVLNNVKNQLLKFTFENTYEGVSWKKSVINLPENGTSEVTSINSFTNVSMALYEDFTNPTKLYLLKKSKPQIIKKLNPVYDSSNLTTSQKWVISQDGTKIPYFLIYDRNIKLNGKNPTLLYGYGGFEYAEKPYYLKLAGKLWLEKGGVYAIANIRGGGEFGPLWHKAALKENRVKAFQDFIAVAEDLSVKKITSPQYLGIMGGSNGGLLVGVAFTKRPDLMNAVVCRVPLLDMLRFDKLLAGASWTGEYGDPDNSDDFNYLSAYSPYHQIKSNMKYPEVLLQTSTWDDRVHPAHARKMSAKMKSFGYSHYFYEEMEGGHGMAADNIQRAKTRALAYRYLVKKLMNK